MKCINNVFKKALSIFLTITAALSLSGCGSISYDLKYDSEKEASYFLKTPENTIDTVPGFSSNLVVVTEDYLPDTVDTHACEAAILFNISENEVLYSKNAFEKLYPASLTKVMTALVALKNGNLDQTLTATKNIYITESGAQLAHVKAGDTMTLDQALHILLMYSANDVANLIAENIGGSIDNFVNMMNEEANSLGATGTHFANPHGLHSDKHYTTAYDLYLIINEALKYDTFNEIISMTQYSTIYYDKSGAKKEISFQNSNYFLKGTYSAPANVTVIGGKTGTTNAAGHCLLIYSKDSHGTPYISCVLRAESREMVYKQTIDLLDEINK